MKNINTLFLLFLLFLLMNITIFILFYFILFYFILFYYKTLNKLIPNAFVFYKASPASIAFLKAGPASENVPSHKHLEASKL